MNIPLIICFIRKFRTGAKIWFSLLLIFWFICEILDKHRYVVDKVTLNRVDINLRLTSFILLASYLLEDALWSFDGNTRNQF